MPTDNLTIDQTETESGEGNTNQFMASKWAYNPQEESHKVLRYPYCS